MHEIPPPPPPYVPTVQSTPRRRSGLVGFLAGALSVGALAGGGALYAAQSDSSPSSTVMPAAALASAADPSSQPTLPPKIQTFVDCLKSNGIEMPAVESRSGGGGSIRWNFPAEGDLKAAVEKCMPEGARIGFGGVIGTRPDGSTIELPQLPDEIKGKIDAFQKCLADNGVAFDPGSGTRPDLDQLKAAAAACGGAIGLGGVRPGR